MVDRNTQASARNRFDLLRGEAENLDIQTRQLTDALETLVRIQARYIWLYFHDKQFLFGMNTGNACITREILIRILYIHHTYK